MQPYHILPRPARLGARLFLAARTTRGLATLSGSSPYASEVFSRSVKQKQRDRAAVASDTAGEGNDCGYLRDEVARRLVDRLYFITRTFDKVVDLGAGNGHMARAMTEPRPDEAAPLSDRVKLLVEGDLSRQRLLRSHCPESSMRIERQFIDEERLPFAPNSVSAFVSNLNLHWVNQLPVALQSMREQLVPDGLLMASMFGGDTLFELRTSLQLAEMDRYGGMSPRVSPMIDTRDVASLLNKAGFTLTTIDMEDIVVDYPDVFSLMGDLRAMGESNATHTRHPYLSRDSMIAADAIYRELHGNPNGTIPATFCIVYMIAWKPSPTQAKPLERGSGQVSMKDALKDEREGKPEE